MSGIAKVIMILIAIISIFTLCVIEIAAASDAEAENNYFDDGENEDKSMEVETYYDDMEIEELKKIAKEKGIKGYQRMKKETLVSALHKEDE